MKDKSLIKHSLVWLHHLSFCCFRTSPVSHHRSRWLILFGFQIWWWQHLKCKFLYVLAVRFVPRLCTCHQCSGSAFWISVDLLITHLNGDLSFCARCYLRIATEEMQLYKALLVLHILSLAFPSGHCYGRVCKATFLVVGVSALSSIAVASSWDKLYNYLCILGVFAGDLSIF